MAGRIRLRARNPIPCSARSIAEWIGPIAPHGDQSSWKRSETVSAIEKSLPRPQEVSGFQVLASALPKMIEAMARPGGPPSDRRLGGITHAVAQHLRAEICSIFLLDESASSGKRLVLEEGYGYDAAAIGTFKNLESGLTARIVNEPADLVANFRVQDHPGWEGQFDNLLQGHCWCLLGVPIIGADPTKVKGAIKLENKRSDWHAPDKSTFIKGPFRKNTPEEIQRTVSALVGQATANAEPELMALLGQAETLSKNLVSECSNLSAETPYTERQEPELSSLDPATQNSTMKSVAWHTRALLILLQRVKPRVQQEQQLVEIATKALWLLETFDLAISAYQPFSKEDLYLMRTVAAMIAAALDIREAAHVEAFRTLEHALKGPGSDLLNIVLKLAKKSPTATSELLPEMKDIFKTALYISGPHAILKGWWSKPPESYESVARLYDRHFENRFLYYTDFAKFYSKSFCFPKLPTIPTDIQSARIVNNPEVVIGALDILVVNAIEHGGSNVELHVKLDDSRVELCIEDDGKGFDDEKLTDFNSAQSGILYSPRSGFGLRFAQRALREAGMEVILENKQATTQRCGARARIRIPFQT
jgi:signal transduction histidine kinase